MIVFLTLCYCALLAVLVKLKVIKLTLFWKLSPILWMLILFFVLFIPMQWAAPTGTVNVYQSAMEIIPNVSGQVVEVQAEGMKPMNEGDTLFIIDPEPFEIAVANAKAALEEAKQTVKELTATADAADATVAKTEQNIDVMKAEEANVQANIVSAEASVREAEAAKERALSLQRDLDLQVATAHRELNRMQGLEPAVAAAEVDRVQLEVTGLEAQYNTATIDVKAADETITKSKASLEVAKTNAEVLRLRLKQQVETELPKVKFDAKQARLAANSMIGNKHTLVAKAEANLAQAEFDLKQTNVKAPADGYPIAMALRPGQRVASFPVRSWMSYVRDDSFRLAVGVNQYAMRFVEVGQEVEVTFKFYPGQTFRATVTNIATINQQGQLLPSGSVPDAPSAATTEASPFAVVVELHEDENIDIKNLPGGSLGTAAIYTDKMKASHLIRRVMIRMEAWMNYVFP